MREIYISGSGNGEAAPEEETVQIETKGRKGETVVITVKKGKDGKPGEVIKIEHKPKEEDGGAKS